jgi:hypothetical protein
MSIIQVQRGNIDLSATSITDAPPASFGSLDYTIVWNRANRYGNVGPSNNNGTQQTDDMSGAIRLNAVDEIEFLGESSGNANRRYEWESWEYTGPVGGVHEFIVRGRVEVTLSGGSPIATNTAAVSGVVDIDRVVPIITGIRSTLSGSTAYALSANAYMSAVDTLTVQATPGSGTTTVYITIVEFVGLGWTISHGETNSGSDTGSIALVSGADGTSGTSRSVNFSNAIIHSHYNAGDTGNVALADHYPRFFQSGTGSLVEYSFDGQADGTANQKMVAHVIENASLNVTRFTDSASHEGDSNVNITAAGLSDINNASVTIWRQSSGTGTAYARNWVSVRLTSTTNAAMWAHRTGNTIATTIEVADLSNFATIGVIDVDSDNAILDGQTDVVINGFGFEAVQGSGTIVFQDATTSPTNVVPQTVTSWSDSSITISPFTLTDGGSNTLPNNSLIYCVVTGDGGEVSGAFAVSVGALPLDSYGDVMTDLAPDHRWRLNNDGYVDSGTQGNRPMTVSIVGDGGSFETNPICEDVTHAWLCDGRVGREIDNSNFINAEAEIARTMGGWYQINQVAKDLSCIYKEGGSVNNICILIGMGNVCIAQLADTSDDNVQAYSDKKLTPNRPYHILFKFVYGLTNEFELFIDGRKQSKSFGNPLTAFDLDAHSGNVNFGFMDTSVEVFGTDVTFSAQESGYFNEWATWTTGITDSDILEKLFRRGARPYITLSGTEANMQSQLDAIANTTIPNWPIGIRVEIPTDVDEPTLVADNITFDEDITEFLEWRGIGTLSWRNSNGTNLTEDKVYFTRSGMINILENVDVTLTGLQDDTEVRIYAAGTQTELAGIESTSGGTFVGSIDTSQATSVDIQVIALGFKNQRFTAIDLTGGNVSIPVSQQIDRTYKNPS